MLLSSPVPSGGGSAFPVFSAHIYAARGALRRYLHILFSWDGAGALFRWGHVRSGPVLRFKVPVGFAIRQHYSREVRVKLPTSVLAKVVTFSATSAGCPSHPANSSPVSADEPKASWRDPQHVSLGLASGSRGCRGCCKSAWPQMAGPYSQPGPLPVGQLSDYWRSDWR
jgi:hypothetical protein